MDQDMMCVRVNTSKIIRFPFLSESHNIGVAMDVPASGHAQLDVDRLSVEYVASSLKLVKELNGCQHHARDQWL